MLIRRTIILISFERMQSKKDHANSDKTVRKQSRIQIHDSPSKVDLIPSHSMGVKVFKVGQNEWDR